ncbi:MAG: glycoside hydrolase family 104 protein [Candidatus Eremiobacteraeota bacterium]|nr:glycoside hydrolase family 104 protein [Candidatus Eremiobacteraeota bacterium]
MITLTATRDITLTSTTGRGEPGGREPAPLSLSLQRGQSITANWADQPAAGGYEFEIDLPRGRHVSWSAPADSISIEPHEQLESAAVSQQVRAFLDMISVPEGTHGPNGYRTCFTGALCVPADFHDHPRKVFCSGHLCSDAAGRYQFLSSTWDSVARALNLKDFSPENQDRAAVELIRRRAALAAVERGDVRAACNGSGGATGVAYEWASLPPGRYGQPSITFQQAEELFVRFGGTLG